MQALAQRQHTATRCSSSVATRSRVSLHQQPRPSTSSSSSRTLVASPHSSRLQLRRAIEEKRETAGTEASSSPDMMSSEQLQKLAELRRQRNSAPQPSSNIVQGAFEEAQLISWPTPGKALLDTVLVLAIVAATGTLLFGLNVVLADASQWWYSL